MTTKAEFFVEFALLIEGIANFDSTNGTSAEKIQSVLLVAGSLQGALYTIPDYIGGGLTHEDFVSGVTNASVFGSIAIFTEIATQCFVFGQNVYYLINPDPSRPPVTEYDVGLSFAKLGLMIGLTAIGVGLGIPLATISVAVTLAALAFDQWTDPDSLLWRVLPSPLQAYMKDPLVLDLDGDGIELVALTNSSVFFDFGGDGFAEKTGWVLPDDGILVRDVNKNGSIDDAGEMFGSPDHDGYAVLETHDITGDAAIDGSDPVFSELSIWRDLNQNGLTETGELMSLVDANIKSISLIRTESGSINEGHTIGYESEFARIDGSTGATQTVYFNVEAQDTREDNTPPFSPAGDVLQLPQFGGIGQINSIAWKASNDAVFRQDWAELTLSASSASIAELKFEHYRSWGLSLTRAGIRRQIRGPCPTLCSPGGARSKRVRDAETGGAARNVRSIGYFSAKASSEPQAA